MIVKELNAGEAFHMSYGCIRPGMGGEWLSFGPGWSWTQDEYNLHFGWCINDTYDGIVKIPHSPFFLPMGMEVCVQRIDRDGALKMLQEATLEWEERFRATGAEEVMFIHWGHCNVAYDSDTEKESIAFSNGVFLGVER